SYTSPTSPTPFPYTTLFRSNAGELAGLSCPRSFTLGDTRPRDVALLRHVRARLGRLFGPGACDRGRNVSLASHASRADVRQPILRTLTLKLMHRRQRIIVSVIAVVVALAISISLLPLPASLRQP